MLGLDVFNSDAFSAVELTSALEKVPHVPGLLGQLPIFTPKPIRTTSVSIEQRDRTLTIIPTTPRGAPPSTVAKDRAQIRSFPTVRIAQSDTLYAHELQNYRAFGNMTELAQLQDEVLARMATLRRNILATHEHMRLGAVQGILYDSDGSTVLNNWYTEFGISAATEIDFDLDNAAPTSGAVRIKCNQVVRAMLRAAKGAWVEGQSYVMGLCGDTFWDQLVAHSEVRGTYLNQAAAAELRGAVGAAFGMLDYGNIKFVNYRGTDNGTSVAVGATKCKFFPVAAPGAFEIALSPAETFDFVNTPGQEFYALTVPDRDRNTSVSLELYSYPLPICTRPEMLQSARNT